MTTDPSEWEKSRDRIDSDRVPRGTLYWFITGDTFRIDRDAWQGNKIDERRRAAGNFFPDEATALKYAKQIHRFLIENNPPEGGDTP